MQVRLGFAIATALKPDILFLDEVLAVGDIKFQAKCFTKIAEIKNDSAVIFVSHLMSSVARISNSVLFLKKGRINTIGLPQDGIQAYSKLAQDRSPKYKTSYEGSGEVSIRDVNLYTIKVNNDKSPFQRTALIVEISIESLISVNNLLLDFVFRNLDNTAVAECPSTFASHVIALDRNTKAKISFRLDPIPLASGTYLCSLFILDSSCTKHYHAWINFKELSINNDHRFTSPMQLPATWSFDRSGS
jgi:lipopolysaccharide transport system ATP-binding protein